MTPPISVYELKQAGFSSAEIKRYFMFKDDALRLAVQPANVQKENDERV